MILFTSCVKDARIRISLVSYDTHHGVLQHYSLQVCEKWLVFSLLNHVHARVASHTYIE